MCKARKRIRAYIIICSKNHESSLPGSWGALIEGMVVWCCTLPIYAMRWNFLSDLKPISQKKRLARGGGKTANPVGPPFLFISWTRRLTIRRPIPRFWYSGSTATSQIVAWNKGAHTSSAHEIIMWKNSYLSHIFKVASMCTYVKLEPVWLCFVRHRTSMGGPYWRGGNTYPAFLGDCKIVLLRNC